MSAKRHFDASAIQEGASNPCAIAKALVRACEEVLSEGGNQRTDPAVRLIAHQLAFLLNVREIDDELMTYSRLTEACALAKAEILAQQAKALGFDEQHLAEVI